MTQIQVSGTFYLHFTLRIIGEKTLLFYLS